VQLNQQQRTEIRQQVFAKSDVPRVDRVDFALTVGTVVPTHVRFVAVPDVIIRLRPEFRDHLFFVVRDDIIIVDHSHKIIAIMPTGERVGSAGTSTGTQIGMAGRAGSLSLSVEEIRQVQIVLRDRGFDIGVIDGQLGPRTMAALTEFQRQQGLQATGHIDSQTVMALGVTVKGAEGGAQTTGQNPPSGGAQQPTGQAPTQPGTTQSGGTTQQAPANPSAGMPKGGQPSGTTGEGGQKMQQPAPSTTPQRQNPSSGTPSGQSR
jgi:peptidoglycan hydrolase-like protein with peptidoglycan-binding domain